MATSGAGEPTLIEIRLRLDLVDHALVEVLSERALPIGEVIRYKRAHGMAVVDRPRRDAMLAGIEQVASARGVDPRIARQVLRSVIDAFTLLEVEEWGPGQP
jgi:chorismate mutase / prephenate dehydrogenase